MLNELFTNLNTPVCILSLRKCLIIVFHPLFKVNTRNLNKEAKKMDQTL